MKYLHRIVMRHDVCLYHCLNVLGMCAFIKCKNGARGQDILQPPKRFIGKHWKSRLLIFILKMKHHMMMKNGLIFYDEIGDIHGVNVNANILPINLVQPITTLAFGSNTQTNYVNV